MQDSPLPTLIKRSEPGVIQVFYELTDRGIHLYFFDQHGAFTSQWMSGADEYHLLIHQRRFLDAVIENRLLGPRGDGAAQRPDVRFTRIHRVASGDLQLSIMAPTYAGRTITVDTEYVDRNLSELAADEDLTRYIL